MESMSGTGPFLSFPAGKSIFGKAIVAPPVVATALGTIRLNKLLKKTERSSCCILLVGANHGALHWFSIQLPVVVDLHCPEVDFRDRSSGHRFPPGGVCFVDEGDFSVSRVHQLRASESSNVAKELKDVFLRTTTTV